MATEVIDVTDYDDEVTILFSTHKRLGTSKKTAISVEDYRTVRPKITIDLTQQQFSYNFNDHGIEILYSNSPKKGFFCKGESSNSNSPKSVTTPLLSMCEICADEKPNTEMFHILGCTHFYCSDCMSKYVASKLQDNVTKITCPVSGCNGVLEPYHCRSILPKQVFDRWGDALCEAMILSSERFYCPYKDCSALLIDDGNDNQAIDKCECPNCNRLFCVKCKVPWHSRITCVEFGKLKKDERSNEDIMLMKLAKSKNWARCSKCRFYVEKSSGCLFMTCRCGHSFCYHCGAPLTAHYCTKCKR